MSKCREAHLYLKIQYSTAILSSVPVGDLPAILCFRTTPSATTATDIILDRPREVTYYEYQDEGYDNAAYDREYE